MIIEGADVVTLHVLHTTCQDRQDGDIGRQLFLDFVQLAALKLMSIFEFRRQNRGPE